MNTIGLLVGEDADLPDRLIKKLPVSIFSYTVNLSYDTPEDFYQKLRTNRNDTPMTSQPSVKKFRELLTAGLQKYTDIIVVTISSHFSGTYNAAAQAKKLFPEKDMKRIHLIDSQSASGGEALLIVKLAGLIAEGKTIHAVIDEAPKIISHITFIGVFDDPHWLQKGGRINSVQAALVKNMLKAGFRPVLTIKKGEIVTKKIQMKAKEKAEALFQEFKDETVKKNTQQKTVVITHSDCEKDALLLKQMIEKETYGTKVAFINTTSSVIGSHLGPDALLLAWIAE
jgi:fatty acid kinase fatty acid binding subunit